MTLREIMDLLQAEVVSGHEHLDIEIDFAGGSDLMSDVLAFGKPGLLLLTGLSNVQSVRTANIIDAKAKPAEPARTPATVLDTSVAKAVIARPFFLVAQD